MSDTITADLVVCAGGCNVPLFLNGAHMAREGDRGPTIYYHPECCPVCPRPDGDLADVA